jgi:hypothetical protein
LQVIETKRQPSSFSPNLGGRPILHPCQHRIEGLEQLPASIRTAALVSRFRARKLSNRSNLS